MSDPASRPARTAVLVAVSCTLILSVAWLVWPRSRVAGPVPDTLEALPVDSADLVAARSAVEVVPEADATLREVEPDRSKPTRATVEGTDHDLVTIRGQVVDANGVGIESVRVRAVVQQFPLPRRRLKTYTDANGRYVFDQVLPGRFTFDYLHFDYCLVKLHPRMVVLGERIELADVCLYVGARVAGVIRIDGKPAPGMSIYALAERDDRYRGGSRSTVARAEGEFSFSTNFPPGRYRVLVAFGGSRRGLLWLHAKSRTIVKQFDVTPAQREVELAIDLQGETK